MLPHTDHLGDRNRGTTAVVKNLQSVFVDAGMRSEIEMQRIVLRADPRRNELRDARFYRRAGWRSLNALRPPGEDKEFGGEPAHQS